MVPICEPAGRTKKSKKVFGGSEQRKVSNPLGVRSYSLAKRKIFERQKLSLLVMFDKN